jgi:hypothetical protein
MRPLRTISIGPLEARTAGDVVHELVFELNEGSELSITGLDGLVKFDGNHRESQPPEEPSYEPVHEEIISEQSDVPEPEEQTLELDEPDSQDLINLKSTRLPDNLPWDETDETQELFGLEEDWIEQTFDDPATTPLLPRPIPGIHDHDNAAADPAKNPVKWLGEFFRGLFGG